MTKDNDQSDNRKKDAERQKEGKRGGGRLKHLSEALYMELREHRSSFIVYFTLRIIVIVMLILQLLNRNYENVFLCALTLVLLIMPSLVQITFKVELPTTLEIFILVFIFAAEILGEISEFYLVFPFWDTVLHTINGFLAAAIGFSMVDLLNRSEKIVFNLSPLFMAIVAFCFSMTIGVVWEFFEFVMDQIIGYDMQKDTVIHVIRSVTLDPAGHNVPYVIDNITETAVNGQELGLGGYLDIGLIDTMQDLIVNFIGAFIFSVIGFFYVKNRGKGGFANRFIPRRKAKDRDFLKIAREISENGDDVKDVMRQNVIRQKTSESAREDSGAGSEASATAVPGTEGEMPDQFPEEVEEKSSEDS
ncbi:hypothetical protein QUV88_00940 [Mediterraneibacter glycyrrhizinilyticus]|nr:hypothetical protein [Mediterraneibacter glycyrrhizinilyticus]MDM8124139.1 hypothetical protein [Mediterraneibacter glycyrrhizinilyticus]